MKRLAALLFLFAPAVLAATEPDPIGFSETRDYTFDIPSGSLKQSMQRFADVTGAQIAYGSHDALGAQTNPVKGMASPGEALGRMLAGTGLTYEIGQLGHVVIKSR